MLLDNPPESPCFGCGPMHARGLRLQFARERAADGAEEVVCTYTPQADEVGWPGLFHTGLHFLALFETCYWAAWELTGRVHVAYGAQSFDQVRLPRVGTPFTARARVVAPGRELGVRATSAMGDKHCATLEARFRPASRAVAERARLQLPSYLLSEMEP
jgi:acyl-coenzyme A thioesterase PaaI-like protein